MIMWRRWKNGRVLEPQWRDSSGTILLRKALMGPGHSSNISRALKLELHVVPCHIANTVPSPELLAQNAKFSSLTAVEPLTFFGHESSDAGLSFRVSCCRRHREGSGDAKDSRQRDADCE